MWNDLPSSAPTNCGAAWSPSGDRIAFHSDRRTRGVMSLTNDEARDNLAKWSPQGQTIVFDSRRSKHWEVLSMNVDGVNQHVLAVGAVPVFSHAGDWILYQSSPTPEATNFFLMKPDGSGARQLTMGNHSDNSASFSPDDKHIVFCSNRGGSFDLYRMSLERLDVNQLTQGR